MRTLPVIGNCLECGGEDVTVLSRSPATGEVFVRCDCGAEYWENEGEVLQEAA